MGKIVDIPGSKSRATIRARNNCQRGEGRGKAFLSPGTAATCEFAQPVRPSGTVARASWPPMFVELQCISKGPAPAAEFPCDRTTELLESGRLARDPDFGFPQAKLVEFLQRWHDVPPPTPPVEPSPKRFYFSQPISELQPKPGAQPAPNPQAQSQQEPGQPTVAGTQSGGQEN
jgi:hypothetical protein